MPKASLLFIEMTKRVKKLKSKYMSRQLRNELSDPIGYRFDILNMAAYRLLVHAEFEEYIETKALKKLTDIKEDVKENGYGTPFFKNILAIAKQLDEPLSINAPYDEADFKRVALAIIKNAEKVVSKNNGIKRESFLKLALFSGRDPASIDEVLLSSVEAYGINRGSVAHKGARHTNNFLSPYSEVNDTEKILGLLRMHFYGF